MTTDAVYEIGDIAVGPATITVHSNDGIAVWDGLRAHISAVEALVLLLSRNDGGGPYAREIVADAVLRVVGIEAKDALAEAKPRLADALRKVMQEGHTAISARHDDELRRARDAKQEGESSEPLSPIEAFITSDGLPTPTAVLCDLMEKTRGVGVKYATAYRDKAGKGMAACQRGEIDISDALAPDWSGNDNGVPAIVGALTRALWDSMEEDARRRVVHYTLPGFAKVPKHVAPMSSAFGAPMVEVDGDKYVPTPDVAQAVLVSRSMPLLPRGHRRRPHQHALPMSIDNSPFGADDGGSLAESVANATQYAISPAAAKVALLALSSYEVQHGKLARATALEIAHIIHPKAARIQSRHLRAVAQAVTSLRGVFLYLPDGTRVQVFSIRDAQSVDVVSRDMEFVWGLDATFQDAIVDYIDGKRKGDPYNGTFLLNIDGAMRIPNNRPSALRLLIRAGASANAAYKRGGEFNEKKLPYVPLDTLAVIANSYQPAVIEYLEATCETRRRIRNRKADLRTARQRVLNDLELLEAERLVVIDKRGADSYRLRPPQAHLDAWRSIREEDQRRKREARRRETRQAKCS